VLTTCLAAIAVVATPCQARAPRMVIVAPPDAAADTWLIVRVSHRVHGRLRFTLDRRRIRPLPVGHRRYRIDTAGVSDGGHSLAVYSVSGPARAGRPATVWFSVRHVDITVRKGADRTPPTVPTHASASVVDTGTVLVTWSASSDDTAVTGYRIYEDAIPVGTSATTIYTRTKPGCGTHTYRVGAYDAAGNLSALSVAASATPCPVNPPAQAPPYDAASPWNVPIGSSPQVDARSDALIRAISDNGLPITSDPDQYTIPVYTYGSSTPMATVTGQGHFSTYDSGDSSRIGHGSPWTIQAPVPEGVVAGSGSDGQIVIVNPTTGIEYGFWQFAETTPGHYTATNGYRYHLIAGYSGRFADGGAGRGAGTPYLAGLVRPWEIAQGHVDHALAFGYKSPAATYVYPASKSDGGGVAGTDLPEGTRLQLDPTITDADFRRMGLSATATIIAHALQRYGMYVIDNSGASKIYLEDRATAHWGPEISKTMLAAISWSHFRVVTSPPH
jgi:hypothetical protein